MIIECVVVLVILIGCGLYWFYEGRNSRDSVSSNSERFEKEYESLNGKNNSYGGTYLEVEIDDENVIHYSSYEEVFSILEGKSGVIYFGFPECPWCRNLVPVLLEAATDAGLDTLYYLNNRSDRDQKSLNDNGKVVVEKDGTEEYYQLVEKLNSVLGEYEGLNDDSIKRLYFPTVVFVKDGKIVDSHIGTLDSQEDPNVSLTDDQHQELLELLTSKMLKVISCSSTC